jgi:hypothetical protein
MSNIEQLFAPAIEISLASRSMLCAGLFVAKAECALWLTSSLACLLIYAIHVAFKPTLDNVLEEVHLIELRVCRGKSVAGKATISVLNEQLSSSMSRNVELEAHNSNLQRRIKELEVCFLLPQPGKCMFGCGCHLLPSTYSVCNSPLSCCGLLFAANQREPTGRARWITTTDGLDHGS